MLPPVSFRRSLGLLPNILMMSKRSLYLQGYKLDPQKIRATYPREEGDPEEDYDLKWHLPIIECIPRSAYKYVGCGVEPDGQLNLVLVQKVGYNKAKMRKCGFKTPKFFPKEALQVLTPGIWPCRDHMD